ncbi:glycosyltransferase family 2 protein [Flavobacterium psychrolimnae]|uniref:Glycosyltransferase family 2 protein n=2 Tax=Flavobacterium psychrolimnae TaxID=249351 RepID=A0A366AZR5_9FLAO|nr:glycosyltransferase family 2 protein [Flavobacterium psychrolimnae]
MKQLVSIIIPCYNDGQYIEQSVNSALAQIYSNIEVIVVDDGSNAVTKDVLKKIEPTITKLITQSNQGQSTARNVGIRAANGEYILVLDSDDFFEPTFCSKAIAVFLNKKEVKIVTCQANLLLENGSKVVYTPKGGTISNFMISNSALGTSMFKKKDWKVCGGYDENMRKGFEDWEFFIRLLKNGGEAEVIEEPLYNYRKKNNSTTVKANQIKYELLQYIYVKHIELYKENCESLIRHFLRKIEGEEIEKLKNLNRIEYKIGFNILRPFRFIKRKFKIIKIKYAASHFNYCL